MDAELITEAAKAAKAARGGGKAGGAVPAVLVTVLETKGSAPRHSGAKMLVRKGLPLLGTVGGGRLEAAALARAGELLGADRGTKARPAVIEVEMLGEAALGADMICGGSSTMLVEPVADAEAYLAAAGLLAGGRRALLVKRLPAADAAGNLAGEVAMSVLDEELSPASAAGLAGFEPDLARKALSNGRAVFSPDTGRLYDPLFPEEKLVILGGGHVGLALARLALDLDFTVTVVDDRPEVAAGGRFPEGVSVLVSGYAEAVAALPFDPATYAVVVTRGHVHDLESARALMAREWRYAGMIGSARKTRLIIEQLRNEGVGEDRLGAFCAPIGLDIDAETPAEIAVSILGEMIATRRKAKALPAMAAARLLRRA